MEGHRSEKQNDVTGVFVSEKRERLDERDTGCQTKIERKRDGG